MAYFLDRREGGSRLAQKLTEYADRDDVVVLGLPRGGIPVAYEIAQRLHAPLDVFVVRKLGMPGHEEYAIGAIASGGVQILDDDVIQMAGVTEADLRLVIAEEQAELERRERLYRGARQLPDLHGKVVILVDDGLATGSTMRAAVAALRQEGPSRVVVAVPVGALDTCAAMQKVADDVVCAVTPEPFYAVGLWYANFTQTTDEEVHELLARALPENGTSPSEERGGARTSSRR